MWPANGGYFCASITIIADSWVHVLFIVQSKYMLKQTKFPDNLAVEAFYNGASAQVTVFQDQYGPFNIRKRMLTR
jgi:hypothetical protein